MTLSMTGRRCLHLDGTVFKLDGLRLRDLGHGHAAAREPRRDVPVERPAAVVPARRITTRSSLSRHESQFAGRYVVHAARLRRLLRSDDEPHRQRRRPITVDQVLRERLGSAPVSPVEAATRPTVAARVSGRPSHLIAGSLI